MDVNAWRAGGEADFTIRRASRVDKPTRQLTNPGKRSDNNSLHVIVQKHFSSLHELCEQVAARPLKHTAF